VLCVWGASGRGCLLRVGVGRIPLQAKDGKKFSQIGLKSRPANFFGAKHADTCKLATGKLVKLLPFSRTTRVMRRVKLRSPRCSMSGRFLRVKRLLVTADLLSPQVV